FGQQRILLRVFWHLRNKRFCNRYRFGIRNLAHHASFSLRCPSRLPCIKTRMESMTVVILSVGIDKVKAKVKVGDRQASNVTCLRVHLKFERLELVYTVTFVI